MCGSVALVRVVVLSCALAAALGGRWQLTFEDDFEGSSIDAAKWNVANNFYHGGNDEMNNYMNYEVSVKNGYLTLASEAKPSGGHPYTSGWVDTRGKFSQVYGRFEINATLPSGKGAWPAHWMLPDDPSCWPMHGEIDIMEYLGQDKAKPLAPVYGTLHWGPSCNHDIHSGGNYTGGIDYTSGFHLFAVEWGAAKIDWYVDGARYWSVPASDFSPKAPFYIILNTAIGGYWPGPPDAGSKFPKYHVIDYVRAYQWTNE